MSSAHVMLDLETLATTSDAAILQLAAVEFDHTTGAVGRQFNRYVKHPTGRVDVPTVLWWMQQGEAARLAKAASDGSLEEVVLEAFRNWLDEVQPEALWSHGATFDIVVLASAYVRLGKGKPWSYRIERDTRTLYALAPGGMPPAGAPAVVTGGGKHDALYDCHVQIGQVVEAHRRLRAGVVP